MIAVFPRHRVFGQEIPGREAAQVSGPAMTEFAVRGLATQNAIVKSRE